MDCYERPMRPDELMHYGILGMRWGVRRYQNPDGTLTALGKKRNKRVSDKIQKTYNESYIKDKETENTMRRYGLKLLRKTETEKFKNFKHTIIDANDITLQKGAVMARVTGTKNEDLTRGPIYGVMLPQDANFYKRNSKTMTWSGKGKQYQVLYKATQDLKAPGLSARIGAFYNICEDLSNRQLKKIGKETVKSLKADTTKAGKEFAKQFINISKGKNDKYTTYAAYDKFIKTVCAKAALNEKHRTMYFNELKRMGYNCMLDENNVGAAYYPFIVFDPVDKLKKYKDTNLGRKNTKDFTNEIMKNKSKTKFK